MYFLKLNILFQSKERPAKTKCMSAKLRVSLCGFRLRVVLFIKATDSLQCYSSRRLTPCSVIHQGVWLRAVLFIKASDSMQCYSIFIKASDSVQVIHQGVWLCAVLFIKESDSMQCYSSRRLTSCSVIHQRVGLRTVLVSPRAMLVSFGLSNNFRFYLAKSTYGS